LSCRDTSSARHTYGGAPDGTSRGEPDDVRLLLDIWSGATMNYHDVSLLIEQGEGFSIEFKRRISSPAKIARTIISFANTKGGTILFGVDDDGSIVGVESEKSEVELVGIAGSEFCDPPIQPAIDIVPFDG